MKWFEKHLLCNIFALQRSLATNHERRSSDYEMALKKMVFHVQQHQISCKTTHNILYLINFGLKLST